jgi:hypothetical protein
VDGGSFLAVTQIQASPGGVHDCLIISQEVVAADDVLAESVDHQEGDIPGPSAISSPERLCADGVVSRLGSCSQEVEWLWKCFNRGVDGSIPDESVRRSAIQQTVYFGLAYVEALPG